MDGPIGNSVGIEILIFIIFDAIFLAMVCVYVDNKLTEFKRVLDITHYMVEYIFDRNLPISESWSPSPSAPPEEENEPENETK